MSPQKNDKLLVAMSGGVDSLTAAALSVEAGFDVTGIHFVTGFEQPATKAQYAATLKNAADFLGIGLVTVDVSQAFEQLVVQPFVSAYGAGLTPNPCLYCNRLIKFGILLEKALQMGATRLATGHYARLVAHDGIPALCKGADSSKDQSYFLALAGPKRLSKACFPLGMLTKNEVRKIATERGFGHFARSESQEVCFVSDGSYKDFLEKMGVTSAPGPIVNPSGRAIGSHRGLHAYTVGQRRGLNCPSSEPWFVTGIDIVKNTLFVGRKADLYRKGLVFDNAVWFGPDPEAPFKAAVRIRYRHKEVPCLVEPLENNRARVLFDAPQKAPTPGQGAVLYEDDRVLGAGIIVASIEEDEEVQKRQS
ncbi:MAG: tRNA 2-thiouridine(34) synthase MnmA [Desulfatibacillaceae bacterium]|nr:tRNA 2-thiouridine(34) synthase MnmA [Desulfatibacillaceae bacterium]